MLEPMLVDVVLGLVTKSGFIHGFFVGSLATTVFVLVVYRDAD